MLSVMLFLSILLGLLPLGGIVWIVMSKSVTTVDGLFMSLILLTLSGVFLLNAFLELRGRGALGKEKAGAERGVPPAKEE